MTTYEPRAAEYLAHIVDAAEWIATVTVGLDEPGFVTNRIVRDVVVRNLILIGEAAGLLLTRCPLFVAAHAELPLQQARAVRNRLTHGYETLDFAIIWRVVCRDLPALVGQIRLICPADRL